MLKFHAICEKKTREKMKRILAEEDSIPVSLSTGRGRDATLSALYTKNALEVLRIQVSLESPHDICLRGHSEGERHST